MRGGEEHPPRQFRPAVGDQSKHMPTRLMPCVVETGMAIYQRSYRTSSDRALRFLAPAVSAA
jgi:hypothetical protein